MLPRRIGRAARSQKFRRVGRTALVWVLSVLMVLGTSPFSSLAYALTETQGEAEQVAVIEATEPEAEETEAEEAAGEKAPAEEASEGESSAEAEAAPAEDAPAEAEAAPAEDDSEATPSDQKDGAKQVEAASAATVATPPLRLRQRPAALRTRPL